MSISKHGLDRVDSDILILGSPPRSIEDLRYEGGQREQLLRVPRARVIFADYHLLQHDFPHLPRDLAPRRIAFLPATGEPPSLRVRRAIDAWLIDHCAVLSSSQVKANLFNKAVTTTGQEVGAFRPEFYGRAAVIPVEGGLLDVKGIGAKSDASLIPEESTTAPNGRGNGNPPSAGEFTFGFGILRVAEILKDSAMQWLCDAAFREEGRWFRGVPVYAAIDLGIRDIYRQPMGVQIRRAHRRPNQGEDIPPFGSVESRLALRIERTLRGYGITSCRRKPRITLERRNGRMIIGDPPDHSFDDCRLEEIGRMTKLPEGRFRLDALNVQFAGEPREEPSPHALLVDYQEYNVRRRFRRPLVNVVGDRLIGWGGALWPSDPDYVQPQSDGKELGVWRRLNGWSRELANGFAGRHWNGAEVLRAMREAVSQRAAAWRAEVAS